MNKIGMSIVRRAFLDESGQTVLWLTAGLVTFMGLAGLSVDVGHAFVVRAQIQNGTNAAALAAAQNLYAAEITMQNAANTYGSGPGSLDPVPYVTNTPTVTPICITSLAKGGTCVSSSSNPNPSCLYTLCNAVKVTQTASVPTTFLAVLNFHNMAISTQAFAALGGPITTSSGGGGSGPYAGSWNIAVIEDATGSMANADSNCPGGVSEFACAVNGIQTFLAYLNPCPTGISPCTPTAAKVRVGLFSFPNMLTSEIPKFYSSGCSSSLSGYLTPKPYQVYTLPLFNATSYTPLTYTENGTNWTASYEFTWNASSVDSTGVDANGFVSDYYDAGNTTTGNLNPNSPLVRLVGYGGTAGQVNTGSNGTSSKAACLPISNSGIALNGATGQTYSNAKVNTVNVGEGITYYAAVIYAAQAALTAEATAYQGSSNAIILLSDGQANTQWIYFPQGTVIPSGNPAQGKTNTGAASTISATLGLKTLNTAFSTTAYVASQLSTPNQETTGGAISGLYPDFLDECQQAITAAQYAANVAPNKAGQATRVYAIAYGSEGTGCGSGNTDAHNDVTTVATGLNQSFSASNLTPCITMENIASDLSYFYSDWLQSGSNSTCIDNAHTVLSLEGISTAIAASLTQSKLLPYNVQ